MRLRSIAAALGASALVSAAIAQQAAPAPVLLARDTPVVLLAPTEIRSDTAAAGTMFKLRVQQPITVAGGVIVPVGTPAFGQVVSAEGAGGLGKSGTMEVKLRYIQLGEVRIPIEGDKTAKGVGAGSAAMAVVFAGVTGLFHRGNNAKIKAGELLSGFVSEDVLLDPVATPIRRADPVPALAPLPAP